jgi:prephenate dehydrogenase
MPRLGIIGTGMIGASIGLAARERGWDVIGHDIFAFAQQMALDAGAIGEIVTREEIYERSELIVIAAHVDATVEEVTALRSRLLRDEQLVIDVASVKEPIARAAGGAPSFVPTHPMAGSERSGPNAARADLFEGRTWVYIPTPEAARTERARAFIASLGAAAIAVPSAEEHDRIVALTSHLPQLIAYAFTERVAGLRETYGDAVVDALCGPAARELLRLGRSSPQMWNDIFAANGGNVESEFRLLVESLDGRRLSG